MLLASSPLHRRQGVRLQLDQVVHLLELSERGGLERVNCRLDQVLDLQ